MPLSFALHISAVILAIGAADSGDKGLPEKFRRLVPLHTRLGPPQAGDWIVQHPEPGQTYQQYVRSQPIKPSRKRRMINVQPVGDFTPTQRKIIDRTAEFLGIYFDLPVKVRDSLPLNVIPAEARRTHPTWGDKQILSTYVLEQVLRPRLPDDAAV